MRQVVTITPDGGLSGLQRKRGQGIDLRAFGPCRVMRASHILPTDDGQHWFVELLVGPHAGRRLDEALWAEAVGNAHPPRDATLSREGLYLFVDYDMAVQAEIEALDGLRLRGGF